MEVHSSMYTRSSSVRLHAPPGGKTSISFGSDEPVKETPAPAPTQAAAPVEVEPVAVAPAPVEAAVVPPTQSEPTPVSNEAIPTDNNDESRATRPDAAPPVTGSRPSTKVRQPPGGASSISFF
eukprot:TRINITY_DN64737_c0_g1_i1.p1 TRINITY_DN64737_c0_g1~~TRINITY_DN64737_c0_g1_i1.p1  ORF type:complete len:131 (+),score=22.78 TRINITY_DN64737_c0_g1_i1:27-395(+)